MQVFLTGATGYIGSAVAEVLKLQGHRVLGLARTVEKVRLLETRGHIARPGSLADAVGLAAAARECEGVIHTAMEFGPEAGARDRAAVEAMISALEGSGKPLIYTSGVWVFGDTPGRMLGEIASPNPPPLVAWRPAVENLVLSAKEKGVKSMVLRPGMVFGRKGGALAGFFRDARENGVVRIIGDGENHWSSVHIDDLADLYARALAAPSPGELFIACGGMPQQVKKIALAVAGACGIVGKIETIPVAQARAQIGPIADCLAMDIKTGSTKAARFFGWMVRRPSIFDEIASGSYLV